MGTVETSGVSAMEPTRARKQAAQHGEGLALLTSDGVRLGEVGAKGQSTHVPEVSFLGNSRGFAGNMVVRKSSKIP